MKARPPLPPVVGFARSGSAAALALRARGEEPRHSSAAPATPASDAAVAG